MGAISAWIVAWIICGLIPPRLNVWRAGVFLLLMVVTVFAVDLGILYAFQNSPGARDSAAFDKLSEDTYHQLAADSDAYFKELYGLGYPEFLHPASLGAPKGLERAQEKIKNARAIVKRYQERNTVRISEFRAATTKVLNRENSRKAILAAFETGLEKGNALRLKLWELQDQAMAEYQSMLDDLAEARDRWYTDGDKIVFSRQRDLDTFNKHLQTAARLEKEAAALQQKAKAERERLQSEKAKS
jgi:hypothetical protein